MRKTTTWNLIWTTLELGPLDLRETVEDRKYIYLNRTLKRHRGVEGEDLRALQDGAKSQRMRRVHKAWCG